MINIQSTVARTRDFAGLILAVVLILFVQNGLVQPVLAQSKQSEDWPRFLGQRIDGKSIETGIVKDWSKNQLPLLWKIDVGDGYGIGSISQGTYFHFDLPQPGVARLQAIDVESGKPKWKFSYPSNYEDLYGYDSGPRASPLVDGDHVYIYGVEGMLHCLNVNSGEEVWKVDTGKKFGVIQNFFGVASCPVVHDDLLIVMIGGSPEESKAVPSGMLDRVKPNGAGVVAFDKLTGKVRYKIANDLASYSSIQLAEINGSTMVLAWLRDSIIGFRPEDGAIEWSFPWRSKKLESVNASTPIVSGNKIFISECYEIGSVLLKLVQSKADESVGDDSPKKIFKPEVVWQDGRKRDQSMAAHWNTPVLHEGYLYGCTGRHRGSAEFRCVEFETGKVMWSVPDLNRTSATYCDGHLIVMGEESQLYLIKASPEKFELVTTYEGEIKFRPPCWAAPIVANGKMYVRGKKLVACFQLIESR